MTDLLEQAFVLMCCIGDPQVSHCPYCSLNDFEGFDRSLGVCSRCKKPVLRVSERIALQKKLILEPLHKRDYYPQLLMEAIEGGSDYVGRFAWIRAIPLTLVLLIVLSLLGRDLSFWDVVASYVGVTIVITITLSYFVSRYESDVQSYLSETMDNYERRRSASVQVTGNQEQSDSFQCSSCSGTIALTSDECPKCHAEVGFGISQDELSAGKLGQKGPYFSYSIVAIGALAFVGVILVALNPSTVGLRSELQRLTVESLSNERISEKDDLATSMLKVGCALDLESCAAGFVQSMRLVEERNFLVARYAVVSFFDTRIACLGAIGQWRCGQQPK